MAATPPSSLSRPRSTRGRPRRWATGLFGGLMGVALLFGALGGGACISSRTEYDDYVSRTTTLRGSDAGPSDVQVEVDPAADFSGTYFVACLPNLVGGDASLQFMFLVDLKADLAAGTVDFSQVALKEDATIISKSSSTGDTYTKTAIPVAKGQFAVNIGDATIPGDAQRIGTSNLVVTGYQLLVTVTSKDSLCGELNGKIVSPLVQDLSDPGDVCVFKRAKDGDKVPVNKTSTGADFLGLASADFHCP